MTLVHFFATPPLHRYAECRAWGDERHSIESVARKRVDASLLIQYLHIDREFEEMQPIYLLKLLLTTN